jgi:hypothetical protein
MPGDTVQVSRAGLVYVIGDVVRPGGFAVDPAQGLTVVQALSLAWGPSQNAATGRALLIREQKGGRTLTTLNLGRMMHGQRAGPARCATGTFFLFRIRRREICWNKTHWRRRFNLRLGFPSTDSWSIRSGLTGRLRAAQRLLQSCPLHRSCPGNPCRKTGNE